MLAILLTSAPAWATTVEDVVADKVRALLPAHLGLLAVELPATAPADGAVAIEWRGKPRAGRSSVLVKVAGRKLWARVTLVERMPAAAPAAAAKRDADGELAPPEPRGQPLRIVARAGGVEVAVTGQLEQPARIGERAVARLADGSRLVRGRLLAPGIFVVETER
jgi:hypothetical protein